MATHVSVNRTLIALALLLASAAPARADPFSIGAILAQAAVTATVGGTATFSTIVIANIAIGATAVGASRVVGCMRRPS